MIKAGIPLSIVATNWNKYFLVPYLYQNWRFSLIGPSDDLSILGGNIRCLSKAQLSVLFWRRYDSLFCFRGFISIVRFPRVNHAVGLLAYYTENNLNAHVIIMKLSWKLKANSWGRCLVIAENSPVLQSLQPVRFWIWSGFSTKTPAVQCWRPHVWSYFFYEFSNFSMKSNWPNRTLNTAHRTDPYVLRRCSHDCGTGTFSAIPWMPPDRLGSGVADEEAFSRCRCSNHRYNPANLGHFVTFRLRKHHQADLANNATSIATSYSAGGLGGFSISWERHHRLTFAA